MVNSAYKHITGMDTVTNLLQKLPREVRSEILGTALAAAARPAVKWAKFYAKRSERTGALRASIGMRVKKYPSGKAVAIVGPTRDYFAGGKRIGRKKSRAGADRPSNYAHLIEFGHVAVKPKKGTSLRKGTATVKTWVPAKPFIRPAHLASVPESVAAFIKGIDTGITRVTNKMIKAGTYVR